MIRRTAESAWRYFALGPSRTRLRRRLLALSAPLVALLLLASGYLFWAYAAGREALALFDRQDVPGLHDTARSLLDYNEVEPWKAHFAEGDAYVLEGRLPDAEREFDRAVALADDEGCPARINLVVVLENLADERTRAGGLAEARAKIAKAQETMRAAPAGCFAPKPSPEVNSEDLRLFAEASSRLAAKADQLAHGDLRYDARAAAYRYAPGEGPGKLEIPPGPGPCPQTNDPEQTACIRDKDKPPPPPDSEAAEQQGSSGSGAGSPPRGDEAPPPDAAPQSGGGASAPRGSGSSDGSSPPGQSSDGGADDIGPDRLPAPGVGPVQHRLSPQSGGDPADKLKQAQADANGSGQDRE
ncbi:tetratricopeptide repeat protein [Segniliparus rugosus]|uniref:Tetratricopeptide repeat protein n=1 Tax=Segniliparus rugosus (strain ATCC BAA-974 / DSM 45345 / CCUG 50838 / CIP 108380 / JCM 13579 / CDC 945) TaxID=679197 RepID=E5XQ43_SEGRC|nr:tetratricopeptide repeat protein [Segniliparus rugosus]EFV13533.1 hypothetical protein HMPREF9336_01615 [Segniliparus rugosus ATCC BAA-974]